MIDTILLPAELLGVMHVRFDDVTDWIMQYFVPNLTLVFWIVLNPLPLIVKTVPP